MTSQLENNNFEVELLDLQKQLGEEKRAHGETIHRYLSIKAQAQTAESEAAKAQELVTETTLKLDQAREEIKGLRSQAQGDQAKIKDLEAQMAQMKVVEQSQFAIEDQAKELETARAKIASLEARMVKVRVAVAESEAKIENLEVQVAQMKLFEQFQAQAEELKAALVNITELEAQMAQREKQAQEEIRSLRAQTEAQSQALQESQAKINGLEAQISQIKAVEQFQAQAQELNVAHAKITELEAQMAQSEKLAQEEIETAQAKINDLEATVQSKPKAPIHIESKPWAPNPPRRLKNSDRIKACFLGINPCPWFGPELLKYFEGIQLQLGKSGLRAEDMVQFLDSWLAGSHPNLEKLILDDFQSEPADFDKFASNLTRYYNNDSWYRSSTFRLERPSDGRMAFVKITGNMFLFLV